jgi:Putative transmembrane protein (PGPGW)
VFKNAIGTWRLFKEIEAGHRFQSRYHSHRRHRQQGETSQYGWMVNLIGGPALITAGFAFLPTPGPSFIIIFIGMWMLAGEFLPLARLFDRLDVRQGSLRRWIKGRWSRLPAISKALVILVCVALMGYGAYYPFFGG